MISVRPSLTPRSTSWRCRSSGGSFRWHGLKKRRMPRSSRSSPGWRWLASCTTTMISDMRHNIDKLLSLRERNEHFHHSFALHAKDALAIHSGDYIADLDVDRTVP